MKNFILSLIILLFLAAPRTVISDNHKCFEPVNYVMTKQQKRAYIEEFHEIYGDEHDFVANLLSNNHDVESRLDEHFYRKFGTYILEYLILEETDKKQSVIESFVMNGVHPFDIYHGEGNILIFSVIFKDRVSFDALMHSNKIHKCKKQLLKVYKVAKLIDDEYFENVLKDAINNVNQ